jgi:hypothetical protein
LAALGSGAIVLGLPLAGVLALRAFRNAPDRIFAVAACVVAGVETLALAALLVSALTSFQ